MRLGRGICSIDTKKEEKTRQKKKKCKTPWEPQAITLKTHTVIHWLSLLIFPPRPSFHFPSKLVSPCCYCYCYSSRCQYVDLSLSLSLSIFSLASLFAQYAGFSNTLKSTSPLPNHKIFWPLIMIVTWLSLSLSPSLCVHSLSLSMCSNGIVCVYVCVSFGHIWPVSLQFHHYYYYCYCYSLLPNLTSCNMSQVTIFSQKLYIIY